MERRELLAGLAASPLIGGEVKAASVSNSYLELKTWRLHNSAENQSSRMADFLSNGLASGLSRCGAKLIGAFSCRLAEPHVALTGRREKCPESSEVNSHLCRI